MYGRMKMEWIQSDEMDSGRLGMGPLALLLLLMALLVRLSISALGALGARRPSRPAGLLLRTDGKHQVFFESISKIIEDSRVFFE